MIIITSIIGSQEWMRLSEAARQVFSMKCWRGARFCAGFR